MDTAKPDTRFSFIIIGVSRKFILFALISITILCFVTLPGYSKTHAAGGKKKTTPNLYFIDAHSQMDQNVDQKRVLSLMDHGGVYRTLLSSHMKRPWQDITAFAQANVGRIIPAVRIKGRGYQNRRPEMFTSRLLNQINSGNFRAMAEVHIWHDSDHGKYMEIKVDFSNSLVLQAFEQAKKQGWPFIIHIEFASLEEDERKEYMEKLETFISKHPQHRFVLIHMAQLEVEPVSRLLGSHKNLHFMTSHADPFYAKAGGKPFINMFEKKRLAPRWKSLMNQYPDRFIFALDNVFGYFWTPDMYLRKMTLWWRALSELPDETAHAIAHGNAERLWKFMPKPDDFKMLPPWISKKKLGKVKGEAQDNRGRRGRGRN